MVKLLSPVVVIVCLNKQIFYLYLQGLAMSLGAIMGTGMLAQGIQYQKGVGAKQLAWALHAGVMGAVLAPMCFLGGPILLRAAWYTAGIVGGLSTVAVS